MVGRRQSEPGSTGRGMEPFILLLLAEGAAHGYEVAQAMTDWGFRRAARDPSGMYKVLRQLEEQGYLGSDWAFEGAGPARRVYRLTKAGEAYLHERAQDLNRQAQRIAEFGERYRERFPQRR
jgi:PadR family transcriptional regulator, regulatory protein PadR